MIRPEKCIVQFLTVALIVAFANMAEAGFIEFVTVGNPGNVGELAGASAGGYGPDRIVGAVDYTYSIGKYEITTAQYTEFLNAVAATDTYGLYSSSMVTHGAGSQITRSGAPGSYTYSITAERANRPVNFVSWGDAARFANWLTNGQPTGGQDLTTTESGAYYLDGATSVAELMGVTRSPAARYVIPSEDEWYKAAYHNNDGPTGNYWDYPTSTDVAPSNQLIDPDPGNNANFYDAGFTIGGPYWFTPVGSFENSASPYGTYDQGGNVTEWNEATLAILDGARGEHGGHINSNSDFLLAAYRLDYTPAGEAASLGFRVVDLGPIPEPSSALLILGGLLIVPRWWIRSSRK